MVAGCKSEENGGSIFDLAQHFRGRRVMVTGHTGFKGAWMVALLRHLGAEVSGFALDPKPEATLLFSAVADSLRQDIRADIRDAGAIRDAVRQVAPETLFHLAAQPLVLASYQDPVETFATNVVGTATLLDAVRRECPQAVVVVATTDKVYQNDESGELFTEDSPLRGYDPYSSSKVCAEHVVDSFRKSFFSGDGRPGRLATVRGGNVVGGGDFAENRLLPDIVRALVAGDTVQIRNPGSVRPWQHVLDCLHGYLRTAIWLESELALGCDQRAFNFGPDDEAHRTVSEVANAALSLWKGESTAAVNADVRHEAGQLRLSTELACDLLRWRPLWSFGETIEHTIGWYRSVLACNGDPRQQVGGQISLYLKEAGIIVPQTSA